jgi:HMW1C N-terminal/HMW1 domain 2
MAFNLEKFESYVYGRQHEKASRELINLLTDLDANYGVIGQSFELAAPSVAVHQNFDQHVLSRITAAIGSLFADSELHFFTDWYSQILTVQRWLSTLFAASPFRNADHIIRSLDKGWQGDPNVVNIQGPDLIKFCMLYSSESEIPLDIDRLYEIDPNLAVGLCVALISPRFLASPAAHQKREQILPWLTKKLLDIKDLDDLPVGILHDVYMHCSYADRPDKHDVKRSINQLIKNKMNAFGIHDLALQNNQPNTLNGKPVLMVVLEWFTSGHSIYRTHSLTMEAARKNFHVVALGYSQCVDDKTRAVFDEFIDIEQAPLLDQMIQIQKVAQHLQPSILYMPSVGMFPLTMFLANLRVAPLQMMALGHPATVHAHAIDYVVVEEDYVGRESCFSEKLLKLPADGMPYRPSAQADGLVLEKKIRTNGPVQIVLCATTMKLNPQFLDVCREIVARSSQAIHFHFLIGQAQGLLYPQVKQVVNLYLSDEHVTVYQHQPYDRYMQVIANCDFFINPFPFGNTNGIIDTVTCGLVGICKTGDEVHEHIDEGLFRRLEFPSWMIAHDNESYIEAVLRLIHQPEERLSLSDLYSGTKNLHKIFNGRAQIMSERFLELL